MKVVLGGLKDRAEEIQSFLEPRVGIKPSVSGGELEMEDSAIRKGVKPRHVKTYVKRFLHQKGLRKTFRVLVSGSQLTIQELEREEEEKEEKKKEKEGVKKREEEAVPKKEEAEEEGREEKEIMMKKKEAPPAPEKKERRRRRRKGRRRRRVPLRARRNPRKRRASGQFDSRPLPPSGGVYGDLEERRGGSSSTSSGSQERPRASPLQVDCVHPRALGRLSPATPPTPSDRP